MWIADGWKDYEVIDTSCGEKLERWGDYLLVRPDPQVIWDTAFVYCSVCWILLFFISVLPFSLFSASPCVLFHSSI